MTYCSKCGKKNDDTAEFCSKCGATLKGTKEGYEKEWGNRCEEDCHGGGRGSSMFWGIVIVFVGLWIIFEFVLKNIEGVPAWVSDFPFWGIFALIIGVFIILWGVRVISRH